MTQILEKKDQQKQFTLWRWPDSVLVRLVLLALMLMTLASFVIGGSILIGLFFALSVVFVLWLANKFEYQAYELQQLKHRMYAIEQRIQQQALNPFEQALVDKQAAPQTTDDLAAEEKKEHILLENDVAISETNIDVQHPIINQNPIRTSEPEPQTQTTENYHAMTSLWQAGVDWFKGGNSIVRIAVVILLIGVILLLRFASEYWQLTLGAKMAGIAGVGFAITSLGYWLRHKRFDYAVSLQGLGLGILYLVLFSSYHLEALGSVTIAYATLILLLATTLWLALKQNALILAFIALVSGFIAPFLLNTGQNDIPALMGYLFVLNAALAVIAFFKPWRILNTTALLLTFGIGGFAIWQHALDDQKFSISVWIWAIFALYLFISIRDGQQIAPIHNKIKNIPIVDTTLIFATPFMVFSLYAGLVDSESYALSIASGVLAAVYLVIGYFLHRKFDSLSVLSQCFYGLGFVFLALILPFAFNAYWSSVGWAIHGIVMVYFGWRYRLISAKYFGTLLLLISGVASLYTAFYDEQSLVFAATIIMLAYAAAYYILKQNDLIEFRKYIDLDTLLANIFLLFSFISSMYLYQHYQDDLGLNYSNLSLPVLGWFGVLTCVWWYKDKNWFKDWYTTAYIVLGITAIYSLLYRAAFSFEFDLSTLDNPQKVEFFAISTLWISIFIWLHQTVSSFYNNQSHLQKLLASLSIVYLGLIGTLWANDQSIYFLMGLLPIALLLLSLKVSSLKLWQDLWKANPFIIAIGAIWLVWVCVQATGQWLLPYVVLLNPIDVFSIVGFGLLAFAIQPYLFGRERSIQMLSAVIPLVLGLLLVSSILLRALHHYANLPYWSFEAFSNSTIQMSLTILWASIALVLTLLASKKAWRYIWMMGIVVLAIVIAKLVLLDLSHSHTITRIISFIGSGVIMLVIGYFAPLPPKAKEQDL